MFKNIRKIYTPCDFQDTMSPRDPSYLLTIPAQPLLFVSIPPFPLYFGVPTRFCFKPFFLLGMTHMFSFSRGGHYQYIYITRNLHFQPYWFSLLVLSFIEL